MTRFPSRFLSAGLAFFGLALLAGCNSNSNLSDGAQLILSTAELQPGTTFEARFDQPMVRADQVGIEGASSPLIFTPNVAGHFVWKSLRSGVFTPDEPLKLGTRYEIALRTGLQNADGKLARAK